jgi:uncharacterized membrane protein YvbJ
MPKFCNECGFKFEGAYKFCPECGVKVSGSKHSKTQLIKI